jgi:hypothetical protein
MSYSVGDEFEYCDSLRDRFTLVEVRGPDLTANYAGQRYPVLSHSLDSWIAQGLVKRIGHVATLTNGSTIKIEGNPYEWYFGCNPPKDTHKPIPTRIPDTIKTVCCLSCGERPRIVKQQTFINTRTVDLYAECCGGKAETKTFSEETVEKINASGGWTCFLS